MAVMYVERLFGNITIQTFQRDEDTVAFIIRALTLGLILAMKYANDFDYKTSYW